MEFCEIVTGAFSFIHLNRLSCKKCYLEVDCRVQTCISSCQVTVGFFSHCGSLQPETPFETGWGCFSMGGHSQITSPCCLFWAQRKVFQPWQLPGCSDGLFCLRHISTRWSFGPRVNMETLTGSPVCPWTMAIWVDLRYFSGKSVGESSHDCGTAAHCSSK